LKHFTSPDFWALFNSLPPEIQKLARENFELLKDNPRHPSLHFKKAGGYWSVLLAGTTVPLESSSKKESSGLDRIPRRVQKNFG